LPQPLPQRRRRGAAVEAQRHSSPLSASGRTRPPASRESRRP
jgi:hypothetical protein